MYKQNFATDEHGRDTDKKEFKMEFKTVDKEEGQTVDATVEAALNQIEEKKYEMEHIQRGIGNIKKLAVVFSGKDVYVSPAY